MLTIKPKVAPTWFTVPSDSDPASEFLLAPLSSLAWLDVRNEISWGRKGKFSISGDGVLAAVMDSVRDWRNVVNEKGEAIPFSRSLLQDLPAPILLKLASEIVERSFLSETERKNSSSPSTSG